MPEIGRIVTVTAPAREPVSINELKSHSRIPLETEYQDEDMYLSHLLESARETVEDFTRRRLITQTVDEFFDTWPSGPIRLGASPVQSITSVKYTDDLAVEGVFATTEYVADLNSSPVQVRLKRDRTWPTTTLREVNGIVVRYVAGYGDGPGSVPERLRHAILYLAATAYEHRENIVVGTIMNDIPNAAEALMWPYRILEAV